jgi:hypothetical protein
MTYLIVGLGLAFCIWSVALDRPAYRYTPVGKPTSIAVAFDLSPSMLAIPDPTFAGQIPPRYIRARKVLLQYFRRLQEQRNNVLVALIGYTKKAEVLMGWDDSPSQLQQFIEFGLSPGLHTTTGTSIESAVESVIELFDMLPVDIRDTDRKVAIFVSDGEDTLPASFIGYAIEELGKQSFDVIALQTGLLDTNEGVPRYGQLGEFLGFETMGGDLYTVPDSNTMSAIANATSGRGLHVRAEDAAAADKILQFTENVRREDAEIESGLIAVLGMFAVVTILCVRVVQ